MEKKNPSLVIYWKQLGDLLLMEPAFAKLASISGSDVFVSTRPEFSSLFLLMDNIYIAPSLQILNASEVYSFDHRFRSSFRAFLTTSKKKHLILPSFKFLRFWHKFIFNEIFIKESSSKYRAEYFFDATLVDSHMKFRPPKLNPPPKSWKPSYLPTKYALLHTTSAWKNKCWPSRSWAKTIDALKISGIESFVITGGGAPWEIEYVKSIIGKTKVPLINLCGQTSIQEYLAIIFNASIVIAIDGSASHIAAAFNRPTLTLFGPTHPLHWHYPSHRSMLIDARKFSPERKPPMTIIPEDLVIKKAIYLWNLFK